MNNDSAEQALSDVRTHCTQIALLVNDFHQKFAALEQTAQQRYTDLEHAQQALVAHIAQERDRARQEEQQLQSVLQSSTQWLHQSETKLQSESKTLSDDFEKVAGEVHLDSAVFLKEVETIQQASQKAQLGYETTGKDAQDQVEHAHEQVHEQFLAGLAQVQQSVNSSSQEHEQSVEAAFSGEFTSQQQTVHGRIEQLATTASQTIHARGDKLHGDVSHDVDNLHQHQDQHQQELDGHLSQLKDQMDHLGSLVTDTAHGMASGIDGASTLMQETNLGVEEVLKIIQNIESIFQDIIHAFHS